MIIVSIIVSTAIVFYFLFSDKSVGNSNPNTNDEAPSPALYTLYEVSKHSTSDDCWIIVEGRIYDFSNMVDNHPGKELANECGTDATRYFIEGESKFGSYYPLMQYLYIGDVT